jgi:D-alanine-D-alanine ligase
MTATAEGKLKVGVLFGGRSGEHEVSLMSARSVLGALNRERYDVVEIGITHEGRWLSGEKALDAFIAGDTTALQPVTFLGEPGRDVLYRVSQGEPLEEITPVDMIFPVLHGSFGEDGTLQGQLEMAEIPYVGAGVLASAVAMDKALFKSLMQAQGIPVLEYILVNSLDLVEGMESVLQAAEDLAPYPLFTKPANMGSSVGINKCHSRADLIEGLMEASQYDRRILVERGIEAREIEVSILGNEDPIASVPGEIVPGDEFYSYRAKYVDDSSSLHIPAEIPAEVAQEARDLAIQAYKAIDGAGMARVDFLLEKAQLKLYMNEINTIPGFTQISMYPKLWEASGIGYSELMDRLIELGFVRQAQKGSLIRVYRGES